jgi:hypothetical protein
MLLDEEAVAKPYAEIEVNRPIAAREQSTLTC